MTNTWTDIDLEFTKQINGDLNMFTGVDAIKSSIKNIINTMQLQRRMLPTFASRFQNLLFEPMDDITANSIGEEILIGLTNWEPRISVKNINIDINEDQNKYSVTVTFTLLNSYRLETVDIDIIRKG